MFPLAATDADGAADAGVAAEGAAAEGALAPEETGVAWGFLSSQPGTASRDRISAIEVRTRGSPSSSRTARAASA
jgi:hypothetical protein